MLSKSKNISDKSEILNQFLSAKLNMTCNLPEGQLIYKITEENPHPASRYFDLETESDLDRAAFLCTTQNHVCSAYCMRKRKRM
jgi:hypothetical protein